MQAIYPIVLFCYNRPIHLEKTIDALKANNLSRLSELYIYSDAPKTAKDVDKVKLVRTLLAHIQGFKHITVVERTSNMGLAASVISGVSEVLQHHTACIILEDDLETSPFFLNFMNQALSIHEKNDNIFSVSGYCPPIKIPHNYPHEAFLFPRINSWGWATWRNRWQKVDWEVQDFNQFISNKKQRAQLAQQGTDLPVMLLKQQQKKITSWAVRFNQACFNLGGTNVYPIRSMVRNVGADGSGTHMKSSGKYAVSLTHQPLNPTPAIKNSCIDQAFKRFYRPSLYRRCINRIKIAHYICQQSKTI
ncbi:sugar transferase [Geofilum sp. OHC36d9]|uniref:sugar transferase n=1 Tax=Geofilum sp. OHC36d9 TaxID=3458413 RepID=UPI004034DC6A